MDHVHESPPVMLIPLYILAAGALLAGIIFTGIFIGGGNGAFWREALIAGENAKILTAMETTPWWISPVPTLMMVVGALIAIWFYLVDPRVPRELAERNDWLYRFLLNKWYFDELYDFVFVRGTKALGRVLWKQGDGWLIDGWGPDGISAWVMDITQRVVRLQTGYLYHYAFAMLIGVAALVTWLMFAG